LGSLYSKTLIQPGLLQEPSSDVFKGHTLTFNVLPYPELGKDIKPNEYLLQLTIERNMLLEDTKWFLRSYGEQGNLKDIIEGTEITATFNSSESQISGSAGCNIFGARYQITDSTLSISEVISTEMACTSPAGIMEQENEFLTLLSSAETFQTSYTSLTIFCSSGQELYFTTANR